MTHTPDNIVHLLRDAADSADFAEQRAGFALARDLVTALARIMPGASAEDVLAMLRAAPVQAPASPAPEPVQEPAQDPLPEPASRKKPAVQPANPA